MLAVVLVASYFAAVNANHPVVKQLIIDSLVQWVEEYHVDGFRFDLASCLCRGEGWWSCLCCLFLPRTQMARATPWLLLP